MILGPEAQGLCTMRFTQFVSEVDSFLIKGVGTGNDFSGWEFHKFVRVAWGSIITEDNIWTHPKPTKMFWRPDKVEALQGMSYLMFLCR